MNSLLVVEDNPATRKLIAYLLKSSYEVLTAGRCDEALQLVRTHAVDALILDINLGEERSGLDLLHEIRAEPGYRHIPAVACTAYTEHSDRQHLLSEGFDGYVAKPFTREDLQGALSGFFKNGQGRAPGDRQHPEPV